MKHLTALLGVLLIATTTAFAGSFPDISLDALKTAIAEKKVTVIDVNGSDSYKAGHIPGAIDFTADKGDLASKLPADKNALIVAYCGSSACGAYAKGAEAAKALGYTNVQHFKGGLSGWKEAGLDLQK